MFVGRGLLLSVLSRSLWASSLSMSARRLPRSSGAQVPTKICVTCDRPFTWRKKWERCWDEVTTCSKRCNAERRRNKPRNEDDDAEVESSSDVSSKDEDRKAQKKAAKAARRAKREGRASVDTGRKACDKCLRSVDMLIRCRVDETRAWKMVCGRCWKSVSGGTRDGDKDYPFYQYGGLWRNRKQQQADVASEASDNEQIITE